MLHSRPAESKSSAELLERNAKRFAIFDNVREIRSVQVLPQKLEEKLNDTLNQL